jgi:hypothetical protein
MNSRVERLVFAILKSKHNFYFINGGGTLKGTQEDMNKFGTTAEAANKRTAELTVQYAVDLDELLTSLDK